MINMSEYETIELEIIDTDNYAIIYFNRPNQMNALIYKLAEELFLALDNISKNDSIRCVIITGRGKAFCSGGDVLEFQKAERPEEHIAKLVGKLHEVIRILNYMNAPSIAAVNGACFGAGLGLACACDFRICSENARFGSAFTSVGLSPDTSTTFFLPKIVGLSIAREMIFLNRILNSEEAKKANLVSQIFSNDSFLDEIKKLAIKLSNGPPVAFGSAKKLLTNSNSNNLEQHLEEERENVIKNAGLEDFQEGIRSFFEKRKPNFKGK